MSRLPMWIGQHLAALRAMIVFTLICGAIYPLAMLGVAQAAFHNQANGSLVKVNGTVVGSSLLCQEFTDSKGNPLPKYFQPRPSTASSSTSPGPGTSKYGCDPNLSGASNLGTNNTTLLKNIQGYKAAYAAFNHVPQSQIPPDAVTTSGSGLDPYISPQNAADQEARVAAARNLPLSQVKSLVAKYTQSRALGFLGEPRVNVLLLNVALDQLPGQSAG
ncbi:MAG TPA: K(+)-transporting ATPase subunit C [Streptosporangiaceae bacterium]|nr:K(+)-transporting ATPase subunit C [Streptosporangiaceae bacterium]